MNVTNSSTQSQDTTNSTIVADEAPQVSSIQVSSSVAKLSSIAYDNVSGQVSGIFGIQDQVSKEETTSHPQLIFFDIKGSKVSQQSVQNIQIDKIRTIEGQETHKGVNDQTTISGKQLKSETRAFDSYSILRFVKGSKRQGIEISSSGLTVRITKTSSKKYENHEELVLTNMAFNSGLHFWEFIAPISCNNIQMGVYNPVTKKELLNSFKTSTQRVITVCLDFNDESLKFWLNDRRSQNKTLKLPNTLGESGPWIPCVKISGDKNKIILNPFAKEPSDFYEKDFDKKFSLKKFIMPQLHNMICITKLPQVEESAGKIVQKLSEHLKFNQQEIQKVLMLYDIQDSQGDENSRFCFLKFHHHDYMAEFIRKSNNLKVYQQDTIASWVLNGNSESLEIELQKPSKLIIQHLNIPESSQDELKQSFDRIYQTLTSFENQGESSNQPSQFNNLQLTQQQFTDKLIMVQNNLFVKTVTRDDQTQNFEIDQSCMKESLQNIDSLVVLKIRKAATSNFFFGINWGQILKDQNSLVFGLVQDFLSQAQESMTQIGDCLSFEVNLVTAKFTIELAIQHMKSQLDRMKRQYQNNQTIIPTDSLINHTKPEVLFEMLKSEPYYRDPNLSIDELYAVLHLLYDTHEQIWAQTKNISCPADVKYLMQTVSRPFSALNRLGSFVNWGISNADSQLLADSGLVFKENHTLVQIENQQIELHDLAQRQLFNQGDLQALFGIGNRILKGEICENISLSKSLNYLPAQKMSTQSLINDIIASQNNVFSLVANDNGTVNICSSTIDTQVLKYVSFFGGVDPNRAKKLQSFHKKIEERIKALKDYNKQSIKKLVPLSILKGHKLPPQDATKFKDKQAALQSALEKNHKKKAKKAKKPTKVNQKNIVADEVILLEDENEDVSTLQPESKKSIDETQLLKSLESFKLKDVKISGYFLLTKPNYQKVMDPIVVGCIFLNTESNKFYIKAIQIAFDLAYLHCFIYVDMTSGLLYNKLTGKQIEDCSDLKVVYEDILNQDLTIIDLYSLFIRSQIIKKDYVKKYHKQFVFVESCYAAIEIENCKEVIDHTRNSYSIENQEKVHLLIKNQENKTQLVQFYLKQQELDSQNMTYNLQLFRGKEMEVDNYPQRVFQYDNNIIVLNKSSFQILNQDTFKVELEEKLCSEVQDYSKADIQNTTDPNSQYTLKNCKKFSSKEIIPKQQWKLFTHQETENSIFSYSLMLEDYQNQEEKAVKLAESSDKTVDIDISTCEASDILQISSLLKAQYDGVIGHKNEYSLQTSSIRDLHNNLQVKHSWHITKPLLDGLKFDISFPKNGHSKNHLKEVEIEISMKKKDDQQIRLRLLQKASLNDSPQLDQTVKKLPLIVEFNNGSQINDALQACHMTNPDSVVFCTNYPKPEFIFKHIHNHSFRPTQFVIKSKENREWTGVPIGSGLIFASNNLEDLFNTKQFSKFTKQDYQKWRQTRDRVSALPLLSNEPIAFFEMGEQNEITVDVEIQQSFKYVKMIPVSFRERPINYTSKPFNQNQLEIQFFGINGIDLGHLNDQESTGVESISMQLDQEDLSIPLKGKLNDYVLGEIGSFSNLTLKHIKNPKANNQELSLASIMNKNLKNVIYVTKHKIKISEEFSDKVQNLSLQIDQLNDPRWELSEVSMMVSTYDDTSATFKSQILQQNKPKLRQQLLDSQKHPELLLQLLKISQGQDQSQLDKKEAAILCLMNHLKQNSDKSQMKIFQDRIQVDQYLNYDFIDQPKQLQYASVEFLKYLGFLNSQNSEFITKFVIQQLDKMFQYARPIEQIEQVLSLYQYAVQNAKTDDNKISQKIIEDFYKRIVLQELPKYQTEEYITLRSKLNINSFPFDKVSIQEKIPNYELSNRNQTVDHSIQGLCCNMHVTKYNSVNCYNVDFTNQVQVNNLALSFESEQKGLYKIGVRVIVPNLQGKEQIIYERFYDELYFQQLCEKAENAKVIEYFHNKSDASQSQNEDNILNREDLGLNTIYLDLNSIKTRYMKIQVEFLDTYRTIHKVVPMTQIFVRPEFFGRTIAQHLNGSQEQEAINKLFKIPEIEEASLVATLKFKNAEYLVHLIQNDQLSIQHKSCLIKVQYHDRISQDSSAKNDETQHVEQTEEQLNERLKKIEALQVEFRQTILSKNLKNISKKKIRAQNYEIVNMMRHFSQFKQDIGLRYLLKLAELLANYSLKINSKDGVNFGENLNISDVYLNLFKRFSVFDIKSQYPNIQKLLENIFEKVSNKPDFICQLFSEYLLNQNINYNQRNVIAFIKGMKNIDLNDLLLGFAKVFKLEIDDQVLLNSQKATIKDIDQVITRISSLQHSQKQQISTQAIMGFLSIVDDLNLDEKILPNERIRVDLIIKIITLLIENCSELIQNPKQNENYILQYAYQVMIKYLELPGVKISEIIARSQIDLIFMKILILKNNDKEVQKLHRKLISHLGMHDTNQHLVDSVSTVLKWYEQNENPVLKNFYSQYGNESESMYYRHLAMIFKQYGILQKSIQLSGKPLQDGQAGQQLSSITSNLLKVLISNQNSPNYEENFYFIWSQIFKQALKSSHKIQGLNQSIDKMMSEFFKLQPIHMEQLYPKFVKSTEKFVKQSNDSVSSFIPIIQFILKHGFSETSQYGSQKNLIQNAAFNFADSLISIMISSSPQKQNTSTNISVKLEKETSKQLLSVVSWYLNTYVNDGCYFGINGANQGTIMKLRIAVGLSKLLSLPNSNGEDAFTIYIQEDDEDLEQLICSLVKWSFNNFSNQKTKSTPAGQLIYSLSQLVDQMLSKIGRYESAVNKCLPLLMKNLLRIDVKLRDLIASEQINQNRSLQIQKNVNELFLQYFKSWIQSDEVAKRFLTELNGFDFLLDRLFSNESIGLNKEANEEGANSSDDEEDEENQLMKLILEKLKIKDQTKGKPKQQQSKSIEDSSKKLKKLPTMVKQDAIVSSDSPSNKADQAITKIEQKLNVDDWGKNIKLIQTSDSKPVPVQHDPTVWIKYKSGLKQRVHNALLSDESQEYEYSMVFDLGEVIQITEIQMGVVFSWTTYDQDQNYEPLTILLEGGMSQNNYEFKSLMSSIKDYGFESNQVRPYGSIFYPVGNTDQSQTLEDQIANFGKREARYLKIRFRRVIQTNLDQSSFMNQVAKAKSIGISFLSVMGTQPIKSQLVFQHLIEIQKENSLEVLSKFFSGEFTQAFELISEQPQIILKIQNAFDKLAVLLDTKAELIKPIFIAICSKNEQLGDWIMINRLLKLQTDAIKKEQIKFLGEIISSNKKTQYDKLMKLKDFIFDSVKIILSIEQVAEEKLDKIKLLKRFMKLFIQKLREYSNYISSKSDSKTLTLNFQEQNILEIISLLQFTDEKTLSLQNAIITFALQFISPPNNFVNDTISREDFVRNLLKDYSPSKLLIASIISASNTDCMKILLQSDVLKEKILNALSDQKIEMQLAQNTAQIILNCTQNSLFLDTINKSEIIDTIYNFMKIQANHDSTEKTDQKLLNKNQLNDQTLNLLVDTLKQLFIMDTDVQIKYSQILKEDMKLASQIGDVEFISKVIVPILHSEKLENISISVRDPATSRVKSFFEGEKIQAKQDTFFLKSSILNSKQKKTLDKAFREITQDKVETAKLVKSKWELIYEDSNVQTKSQPEFLKFVKAVSNKSNVFILLKAKILEQEVVFGGYTCQPFPNLDGQLTQEFDYQIPFSEANFVFQYNTDKELHYTMTHNKPFGYIYTDYESSGALSISGDFFLISWSQEFSNTCGNIYDMKCIEDPSVITMYNNMNIIDIEVFHCDLNQKAPPSGGVTQLKELKKHKFYQPLSPFNYQSENLVFKVSEDMSLEQISLEILGKKSQFIKPRSPDDEVEETQFYDRSSKLKDAIERDQLACVHNLLIQQSDKNEDEDKKQVQTESQLAYTPNKPMLQLFIQNGGIIDLLQAAKAAVSQYEIEEVKNLWELWILEIESFNSFPNFFQLFTKDPSKEQVIYQLLSGECDIKKQTNPNPNDLKKKIKDQEELHLEMVTHTYRILSQVFETQESSELRDTCLKNGTFLRFIERIGQLTSEKKRIKAQKTEQIIESPSKIVDDQVQQMKKNTFIEDKNKVRKGVGYTTGVGTAWNVNEYLKSKESKNQQIANIMNILTSIIKSQDWQAPQEVKDMILESALLPALEAGFRSGSLLEMAKDYELNISYLEFVKELSNHQQLLDLLLDIGEDYEPRQKESIYQLLKNIGGLSTIFLSCLNTESADKSNESEDSKKPKILAERIITTMELVEQKLKANQSLINKQSLDEILEMPLSEAYHKLLSNLRFEYMNVKNSAGIYAHYYVHDIPKGANPPVSKLVRLAQEIADLSNSLPCDWTNAIFCRVDKERVDVMKCLIMGASGTPYAHGAFIYDLFFENTYPNGPPKCTLVTTGGGTVRFNPNLYTNGKVCLSLLGTWRGSSTENWDPKLSTILQVLLSIQAIIMSNEVYFNEPGYEHEQGTPEGEQKNEGYSNIVRYCNVKFAMIDAIKNPPAGFEKVIKRSFYLKKNEILREVKEWVDRAKVTDATYQGLVYDHNYHWAPQISPEGKYAQLMEEAYKELKETLESLTSPFEDESGKQIQRKFSSREDDPEQSAQGGKNMKLDDIDVSYDPTSKEQIEQSIDINDEKVKDRWSRYIGAMGIEAVAKQAESRILLQGLGPLGIEIAKNIVLAGCKELILTDRTNVRAADQSGQFFIDNNDLQKLKFRDQSSVAKLQQLNYYVKVSVMDKSKSVVDFIKETKDLKVVVLTELYESSFVNEVNRICREKGIQFIYACQNGVFSKVFTDFGKEFIVLDKDGEELQEVLIKDISYEEKSNSSIVTLLEGYKHRYQDGDIVTLKEIQGMQKKSDMSDSLNNSQSRITVINPTSFKLNDVDIREYSSYEGSGVAKQIKVPVTINFKTQKEIESLESPALDENLASYDFTKMENQLILHEIYKVYENEKRNLANAGLREQILDLFKNLYKEEDSDEKKKKIKEMLETFLLTQSYQLPPICAFIGGVVSQEIVKGITQKYMPINQLFYFDCMELFPIEKLQKLIEEQSQCLFKESGNRYDGLNLILGKDLVDKLFNCKLFMIGAGAIGCKLLKNYAMLGLGTGSEVQIIHTDPDVIEVRNLNRQFLFREKPKSSTAATAAIQMNPNLKNHVIARLDKIHDGTSHIYNEGFFKEQSIFILQFALDNVAARLCIDGKCVAAMNTLIDSGTLDPKGHVQLVLPEYKTESYASQNDPVDNTEIPHCTLKMFPEEIIHCIEWAKDIFGKLQTLQPQVVNKYLEQKDSINFADQQELANIKKVINTLDKKPPNFLECDGSPFWSLPKRPPQPVEFDKDNQTHVNFVAACTLLYATIYGSEIPDSYVNPRSQEVKQAIAQIAAICEQPEFIPNDQKATAIQSQVEKDPSKENSEMEKQNDSQQIDTSTTHQQEDQIQEIKLKYENVLNGLKEAQAEYGSTKPYSMQVQEFEKDNDSNYHIDFIYAMANIRAQNYNLQGMDWIDVKIKAGRIIPALATTTAAIAALQTLEVLKYLKGCKLDDHKNSFMNLAVPSLMMSEPGAALKTKLKEGLEVTLWDRWEYDASQDPLNVTLLSILSTTESKYNLKSRDVFLGSFPLFLHALEGRDEGMKIKNLSGVPLIEKLPQNQGLSKLDIEVPDFVDLTVTFVDEGKFDENGQEKNLEGVPQLRVIFKKL
eukprot:403347869